ncbi:MAG TPA: TonB-dependent receptor [Pseudomonadales bacterium]|nr:TonB-dependent receptor [Pseudomonadales bacterium]
MIASAAEPMVEEVTVTGLRGKPRVATDSAVPVDVFNSETIDAVSYTDMDDILQTLVPSYGVARQPISDGATFIRPATLRGLPSHHTLVLVNGKRRHRASLVSIGGSGTQGPDVATIPSIALQSIEVLRDGASSQYGSDAIAGVINFNLKNASEGISFAYDTGEYFEDDGFQQTLQGNIGLPLGDSGFLNISGEWNESDLTQRDEQYCESWFCLNQNSPRYDPTAGYASFVEGTGPSAVEQAFPAGIASASVDGDVVQPWGIPNSEGTRLFYNAGFDLDNGMELYSFGNYSVTKGDGSFFYRYPGNGTIEELREADGGIYTPLEKFPGGFTPRFEGEIEDYSFVGGLRGELADAGGLNYDFSYRYGYNEISYDLYNTINPSQGRASPTAFKPGDLSNEEVQLQADFSMDFDVGLASPMTFAFGASYLDETYEVVESNDPDSYLAGPHAASDPFGFCNGTAPTAAGAAVIATGSTLDCANPDDPVFTVVGVGSNGFPGYSPEFSEEYDRDSYAVYGDLSADVTDALFLQGAVRYEDYSDFGNETVAKIAGRFRINEAFALRASVGTGFRAPTPGQQGTTNVSTRLPNGFPVATGLFPAGGAIAQALGASPLKAETSTNYTLGFTTDLDDLTLTVDFYRIDIDDRFFSISTRDVSADPTAGDAFTNFQALDAAGVAGAESIGGVFYFTNAFDSRTEGVDIVATYPLTTDLGMTNFTASMNYNKSSLESDASAFLNAEEQYDFENSTPEWRGVFTAAHAFNNRFSTTARLSWYGEFSDANSGTTFIQDYEDTYFVDLEGSYQVTDAIRVTLGGRNIFDEYPDKVDRVASNNDYCCGRVYNSGSIVPWQGGYYFLRLNADL